MKERRTHVRIAVDTAASVVVGQKDPIKGTIANFSERGIFLKAGVSPEVHRPVHLNFILKPDHAVCEASGKVAWRGPHGIGVLFDGVNEAFSAFLADLEEAAKSINPAPKREVLERILGDVDIAIS